MILNFNFLEKILDDQRLNVWHVSIILAIMILAKKQNSKKLIRVSRSRIMKLAHINTFPTYHKYFKQLQDFGYIKYDPSYHPGVKSTVIFLLDK